MTTGREASHEVQKLTIDVPDASEYGEREEGRYERGKWFVEDESA